MDYFDESMVNAQNDSAELSIEFSEESIEDSLKKNLKAQSIDKLKAGYNTELPDGAAEALDTYFTENDRVQTDADDVEFTDLFDIDQSNDDLNIDLEVSGLGANTTDVTELEGFEYPAIVIAGVAFNDVLRVLKTCERDSYRACDIWLDPEDGNAPECIGQLPLELETLLLMLFLGVRVTIYLSSDRQITPSLSDPELLEAFM